MQFNLRVLHDYPQQYTLSRWKVTGHGRCWYRPCILYGYPYPFSPTCRHDNGRQTIVELFWLSFFTAEIVGGHKPTWPDMSAVGVGSCDKGPTGRPHTTAQCGDMSSTIIVGSRNTWLDADDICRVMLAHVCHCVRAMLWFRQTSPDSSRHNLTLSANKVTQ